MPCSPILVSRPHGRSKANLACAAVSAASTASSSASGAPNITFSLTLAENSVASSKAQPTAWRSRSSGRSRTSAPSSRTDPEVASASRGTSCSRVDLPEPVAPVSTSVWPGVRSSTMSRSTGSAAPG